MKKSILFCMLSVAAMSLCGCLNPHLSSMGASTMVVAHQPRLAVNGENSAMNLSVDAFTDTTPDGIYNYAVVIECDRDPYTNGLESELMTLAKMPASSLRREP